jgi:hypothetical protein
MRSKWQSKQTPEPRRRRASWPISESGIGFVLAFKPFRCAPTAVQVSPVASSRYLISTGLRGLRRLLGSATKVGDS